MKLDYKKTLKVGTAFAIIMAFWTSYDYVVPLLLENAFGLSNSMRGLIMGLDNLLSLFMLPLFGRISDKLISKYGKRTPFIVVGTLVTVMLMIFVPVSAGKQLDKAMDLRGEITDTFVENYSYKSSDGTVYNSESLYRMLYEKGGENSDFCDIEYLREKGGIKNVEEYLKVALNGKNADGEFTDEYIKYVKSGVNNYASVEVYQTITKNNVGTLVLYMVILLVVLIAMGVFRSPAIALMPDVTPKPLRSQANAMISLAGGFGGAIAFLIYTIALSVNPTAYTLVFGLVAASMAILLALFLKFVKENKLVAECEAICLEYGIDNDGDDEEEGKAAPHPCTPPTEGNIESGAENAKSDAENAVKTEITVKADAGNSRKTEIIINANTEKFGTAINANAGKFGTTINANAGKNKTTINTDAGKTEIIINANAGKFGTTINANAGKFGTAINANAGKFKTTINANTGENESAINADDAKNKAKTASGGKLKRAKFISFLLILASIFMWFLGYNAVTSNLSIYLTKTLNLSAGLGGLVSGISMGISAIAFIPVGMLAVKIGRRKSIIIGFALAIVSFIMIYFFAANPGGAVSILFTVFYLVSGFGLIISNVNTFPMVVELSTKDKVGRYTGFYYVATMSAQAITPFIAGLIMDEVGNKFLFLYSAVCIVVAIVLMTFVKHGDSKAVPPKSKIEMLGDGSD
jgi:MFS family permease